jgi:hypothetical protein
MGMSVKTADRASTLRAVRSRLQGATWEERGDWLELRTPDGCALSTQDAGIFGTVPVSTRLYLTVGRPDSSAPRAVGTVGGHVAYGPEPPDDAADQAVRDAGLVHQLEELMGDVAFVRITNTDITVIDGEPSVRGLERRCNQLRDLATTLEARWPLIRDSTMSELPPEFAALVTRWGEGDDGKRERMISSASTVDLERLVKSVIERGNEIEHAVDVDSDLLWVLEAAAEARRELDERRASTR